MNILFIKHQSLFEFSNDCDEIGYERFDRFVCYLNQDSRKLQFHLQQFLEYFESRFGA